MKVFRLHIRPKGGEANPRKSFDYCLRNKILGMGWPVEEATSLTWDDYLIKATAKYGPKALSSVKCLKNKVQVNDLVWTRDADGNYCLAKVVGPWRYFANKESLDADITNICDCAIKPIANVDEAPGKIVACFIPRRTMQRIANDSCVRFSQYLWNQLSSTEDYKIPQNGQVKLYSMLSSEDCEDVLAIYLQMQGWLLIPNSRKADTMAYEYFLKHRTTHEIAVVQVKTGNTPLDPTPWAKRNARVFLFQSEGRYTGKSSDRVECIQPDTLESFMRNNRELMTRSILHWLELAN